MERVAKKAKVLTDTFIRDYTEPAIIGPAAEVHKLKNLKLRLGTTYSQPESS